MVDTMENYEKFIELKDIIVKSNGRTILSIPHALIPADRITACIGPNGAGKTTLLKLLDGLVKPDSGTVSYSFKTKTALVLHHTPMIKASAKTNIAMVLWSKPVFHSLFWLAQPLVSIVAIWRHP